MTLPSLNESAPEESDGSRTSTILRAFVKGAGLHLDLGIKMKGPTKRNILVRLRLIVTVLFQG